VRCGWDESGRRDYLNLRMHFYDDVYAYSRQVGKLYRENKVENLPPESEYSAAYEAANFTAEYYDIERLMVEVIFLTSTAGRESNQSFAWHKKQIIDILRKNDLETMLSFLPDDERSEFLSDFKALKIDYS
jgi:hypothetical protein